MLRHCLPVLLVVPLLVLPAHAEDITLTVHGGTAAGTMPTYFEPSAFFGWTSTQMKIDFGVDAGSSHGLVVESTQLLLGPSTSLADYQTRLAQSGLATVAALTEQAGAQFLLQVHGMPRWISSSQIINTPPGCEEEWPTYQTVAPDLAKWADWEAAIAATVTYFNLTHGLSNVWYQFWEEPDSPCFWTDTEVNFLETWRHFVLGARSADPAARVGGPEPAGGPESIKPRTSWSIMQSFIEFSATEGIQPDFISYHLFGNAPEQNRRANRQALDLLSANGFGPLPSSWAAGTRSMPATNPTSSVTIRAGHRRRRRSGAGRPTTRWARATRWRSWRTSPRAEWPATRRCTSSTTPTGAGVRSSRTTGGSGPTRTSAASGRPSITRRRSSAACRERSCPSVRRTPTAPTSTFRTHTRWRASRATASACCCGVT